MTTHPTLMLTSPHTKSAAVKALQKQLAALGYDPGPIDGEFGPATDAACREFDKANGLAVNHLFGPRDWKILDSGKAKHAPDPSSVIGKKALAEAVKWIGTKEEPAGSNRTPFGEWFGVNGQPWCNIFVSWCFEKGAGYQLGKGQSAGVYPGKGIAYVPTTEAWLRASGFWIGRTTPLPGDIAIYNWDGGVADHIGIVESAQSGGRFTAIEGNTSKGDNSNGGEVQRRDDRVLANVNGFGRIK